MLSIKQENCKVNETPPNFPLEELQKNDQGNRLHRCTWMKSDLRVAQTYVVA